MRKNLVFILIISLFQLPAFGATLKTDKQKISYIAIYQYAMRLKKQGITLDPRAVSQAVVDVNKNRKPALTPAQIKQANQAARKLMLARRAELKKKFQKLARQNLQRAQAFLKLNKKKKGVITTNSGLQYKVIKAGKGPKPKASDTVTVNYRGTLLNGKLFDKSSKPVPIPLAGVIPGWREAVMLMRKGGKIKAFIPPNLGYGPRGSRTIAPNSLLIFDIELVDFKPTKKKKRK